MPSVSLLHLPVMRFLSITNQPLAGAKLYSFEANSNIPKALYADPAGGAALPNPAIADALGQIEAYVATDEPYKLDLFDANDVHQPGWPIDGYQGISTASGTWTPVVEGGTITGVGAYQQRVAYYQRVGTLVNFSFYLELIGHTGTGIILIRGFPSTAAFGGPVTIMVYGDGVGLVFDGSTTAYLREPTPQLELYSISWVTGGAVGLDVQTLMGQTTVLHITASGTYVST